MPLRYPVRALAGTNEETGMKDVEYYLAHNPAPVFCFTPDAEFPRLQRREGPLPRQAGQPGVPWQDPGL